jgi:hypothetical protein
VCLNHIKCLFNLLFYILIGNKRDGKDLDIYYERQESYLKICEELKEANETNNRLINNITLTISEKQLDKSWIGTLLV